MLFGQSSSLQHGIMVNHSWSSKRVGFSVIINQAFYTSENTALQNTINYVIATHDGSTQKIYLNGQFSTSRSYSSSPVVSNPSYRIGKWGYSSYQRNLQGKIYSVALYNRALTAEEIKQNYNATRGRFQ